MEEEDIPSNRINLIRCIQENILEQHPMHYHENHKIVTFKYRIFMLLYVNYTVGIATSFCAHFPIY